VQLFGFLEVLSGVHAEIAQSYQGVPLIYEGASVVICAFGEALVSGAFLQLLGLREVLSGVHAEIAQF